MEQQQQFDLKHASVVDEPKRSNLRTIIIHLWLRLYTIDCCLKNLKSLAEKTPHSPKVVQMYLIFKIGFSFWIALKPIPRFAIKVYSIRSIKKGLIIWLPELCEQGILHTCKLQRAEFLSAMLQNILWGILNDVWIRWMGNTPEYVL